MKYSNNMNVSKVNDNKIFLKTVKLRFSDKSKIANIILLTEGNAIIKNEKLTPNTFNNYLDNTAKTLDINLDTFDINPLSSINEYLKSNVSVIKTKEKYNTQEKSFSFPFISKSNFLTATKSLPCNKVSPFDDILIAVLKYSIHAYSKKLRLIFSINV